MNPRQNAEALIRERLAAAANSVVVEVNDLQEWVTISDPDKVHETIFMEGHHAEPFADQVTELLGYLPEDTDLCRQDIETYVALRYAENHWN